MNFMQHVVALVAPVDQLSPAGGGLVVSHHLTILLLMKILILTLGGTRVHRYTNVVQGGRGVRNYCVIVAGKLVTMNESLRTV